MTVKYLVCATEERGIADANERGWTRLAYARFATPEKDDVRLVRRFVDFIPVAGTTAMMRGSDYDDGPPDIPPGRAEQWLKERASFDKFVEDGHGVWV
jgi:hypothetical protein